MKPAVRTARQIAPVYHPGPLIDNHASLAAAIAALRLQDPAILGPVLDRCGPVPLRASAPGFSGLASMIISQQVSVASASAIMARLAKAFDPMTAEAVLAADENALRACGLSGPKIRSLHALAGAMVRGGLDLAALQDVAAEKAHAALIGVKGIGPWTADIFLMFCLGHPDAWPSGDIALQEAAKTALGLNERPSASAMDAIGERWRPNRAVAARILWAFYKVIKAGREGVAVPPG